MATLRVLAAVAVFACAAACSGGGGGGGGGSSPAPTGLAADYIAANTIHLTWTNVATTGSGTSIERRPASGGSFAVVGTTGALSIVSYDDASGVEPGTKYEWRVRTIAADGPGKPSNVATPDPPPVPPPPSAPAGLTTSVMNVNQIKLDWTYSGTDVKGFRIERLVNYVGFPWTPVTELPADARTFTDTCLMPSTPYKYRVTAYNEANVEETIETPANTTTSAPTMGPSTAPNNLEAVQLTPDSYRIQWQNGCTQQDRLFVEVSVNGGAYQNVLPGTQRFSGDATWFLYVNLPQGSTYTFKISAENAISGISNGLTATATGPSAPPPATGGWVSIAADYDNDRIYSDLVESANATAYPNGKLPVGCFWSFNSFLGIQDFMCYSAAIHFPLTGLAGKTVDQAYLVLGVSSPPINPTNINCTAIASSWSTSTLNGNQSLSLFSTGASVQGSPTIYGPYGFDVTGIVQNWANGAPNNGILLEDAEFVFPYDDLIRTSWFFSSDEFGGDAKNKPTLWISYH